jgi:predicted MFS family arabinose efflux permease
VNLLESSTKARSDLFIITTLALGAVLVVSLMYVTIPLIPVFEHHFKASQSQAIWAGSAFGFAYALGNVVFGTLSDRFRRRTIIGLGLISLTVISIAVGLSPSLGWLIALRAVQGFIASSFPPVALAYVGDVITPRYRAVAVSIISSGFLLAGILGQLYSAAVITFLSWSGVFAMISLAYTAVAIFVFRLPAGASPNKDIPVAKVYGNMIKLLSSKSLLSGYAVAVTVLLSFVAMYSGLGSYVAARFDIHAEGLMWIRIAGIPAILLSPLAGHYIHRLGGRRILIAGLLTAGAGISLEAWSGSVLALVLSSVIFVAGISMAVPSAIVLVGQLGGNARGSAIALYGFFIFVGASLGPLLAAYVMPFGFSILCTVLTAVLVLAAIIAWQGLRHQTDTGVQQASPVKAS